jgi:hypothetical protein
LLGVDVARFFTREYVGEKRNDASRYRTSRSSRGFTVLSLQLGIRGRGSPSRYLNRWHARINGQRINLAAPPRRGKDFAGVSPSNARFIRGMPTRGLLPDTVRLIGNGSRFVSMAYARLRKIITARRANYRMPAHLDAVYGKFHKRRRR